MGSVLLIGASGSFIAGSILVSVLIIVILFITVMGIAMRFKKCPSDQILVIYGKTNPV